MNLKALRDKINGIADQIEAAVNNEEFDKAVELKKQHETLMAQYDALKDLEIQRMQEPANVFANPKKVNKDTEEFLNAVRSKFQNVMTEAVNADGGYTVPEDVQTKINKYKETHRSLRDLVSVEKVGTKKGSRVYQTKSAASGFSKVTETGLLTAVTEPSFTQVTFDVDDYGGYLPISNDLIADTSADLEGTIVDWIGKNSLATDNAEILTILKKGSPATITTIDKILEAACVTVGSAYDIKIVTNDSGKLWLATQKDDNGRSIVQPNPAEPKKLQLCVGTDVYDLEVYANTDMPNVSGKAPIFVGDLKEAVKVFDRQQTTMFASNTASVVDAEGNQVYNAFQQRGQIYRADMRADYKEIDGNAWVYALLGNA